jgi:ATP-dependent RNA helicase RhlE
MARTGFDRFDLHETLMRGIRAAGFDRPWPIQFEAIPAGLEGRDVLGLAQTGTGKTAAFALPLLDRLLDVHGKDPRVLVLAPTRELASQITGEIRTLSRYTRVKTVTIYGGVSMLHQVKALRQRPEIVVGCPGRVLDLLRQGVLRLGTIETLVLDEADHMFDMGFLRDIRKADATPAATIDHALYPVAEERKRALLEVVLTHDDCDSAIVFTRTKQRAKRLADQLKKEGHRAVGLQGNMSQTARDRAMSGFRSRRYDILVATDIAARGIDVSDVSHVINFDVPNTPEAYTHRIGRTGRAEREGVACTFVTHSDRDWVRATERMIGAPIQRREAKGFDSPTASPEPRRSSHGPASGEPPAERQRRWRRNTTGRGRNRRRAA